MGVANSEEATNYVNEQIKNQYVVVFSKSYCPYCVKVTFQFVQTKNIQTL